MAGTAPDGPRRVRVGVLGCGNVGGALVELVDAEAAAIAAATGLHLEVTKVAVRNLAKHRAAAVGAARLTHDAHGVATDPDVDVVVELVGGIRGEITKVRTRPRQDHDHGGPTPTLPNGRVRSTRALLSRERVPRRRTPVSRPPPRDRPEP